MKIDLSDGSSIAVTVTKKAMKSVRLRVCRDGKVCVSAPTGLSDARIYEFLCTKKGWIESHIKDFQKSADENTVHYMGSPYSVEVVKDRRTGVALNEEAITIFCARPEEYQTVLEDWWKKQAFAYLTELVNKWYPIVCGDGKPEPQIKIRKMRTLWGSCTSKERTIRFNYYLLCAPQECIEYVVVHELIHLIHPDHGIGFRSVLTQNMQDWKERKQRLERESHAFGIV